MVSKQIPMKGSWQIEECSQAHKARATNTQSDTMHNMARQHVTCYRLVFTHQAKEAGRPVTLSHEQHSRGQGLTVCCPHR